MLREFTLPPNAEKRLQVEGKYLIITQATGPVELSIGGTLPITVDEKDRIHLRDDSPNSRSIRIKNVSGGENVVQLHTSDLLIDKRTAIDVNNAVSIAEDQLVGIDPTANIVQAVVQNAIRIDQAGNTVRIQAGEKIGIDPAAKAVDATVVNAMRIDPVENEVKATLTQPVVLALGQTIGIDPAANAVSATVVNAMRIDPVENEVKATLTQPVVLAPNQLIGIDPDANLVKTVHAIETFATLPTVTFAAGSTSADIAANANRSTLWLTAEAANQAPVWIGGELDKGLFLAPGERLSLPIGDVLTVAGAENDKLYLAETVYM